MNKIFYFFYFSQKRKVLLTNIQKNLTKLKGFKITYPPITTLPETILYETTLS